MGAFFYCKYRTQHIKVENAVVGYGSKLFQPTLNVIIDKKNIENQHFLKEMQSFLKEKKTYSDKIFFILYSFRIIES
jgi:hypothetical protein